MLAFFKQFAERTEKEMLETKNFGRKSLEELQQVLSQRGLNFGMKVADAPPAILESAEVSGATVG